MVLFCLIHSEFSVLSLFKLTFDVSQVTLIDAIEIYSPNLTLCPSVFVSHESHHIIIIITLGFDGMGSNSNLIVCQYQSRAGVIAWIIACDIKLIVCI